MPIFWLSSEEGIIFCFVVIVAVILFWSVLYIIYTSFYAHNFALREASEWEQWPHSIPLLLFRLTAVRWIWCNNAGWLWGLGRRWFVKFWHEYQVGSLWRKQTNASWYRFFVFCFCFRGIEFNLKGNSYLAWDDSERPKPDAFLNSSVICTIYILIKTKKNGVSACTWRPNHFLWGGMSELGLNSSKNHNFN